MDEINENTPYQYFALYFDLCDWQDEYPHVEWIFHEGLYKPVQPQIHWVNVVGVPKDCGMQVLHFT